MLATIAVVFIVLWLLGLVALPAAGGLIHVLIVVALILIIIRLVNGNTAL